VKRERLDVKRMNQEISPHPLSPLKRFTFYVSRPLLLNVVLASLTS